MRVIQSSQPPENSKEKMSAIYDVLEAESNLTSFEHSKAMGVDTHLVSSTN